MKIRWIVIVGAAVVAWLAAARKIMNKQFLDGMEGLLNQYSPTGETFSPEMVEDLPDPARRYFLRAIDPGTPLAGRLRWDYTGEMKPGADMPWMPLNVSQTTVFNRGFVWRARAGWVPLVLTGADHYLDGDSRMAIDLFGVIPVVNESDRNIAKSAMGRLLIESFAIPSSLLPSDDVTIMALDNNRFQAIISHLGEHIPLTLEVNDEGRLVSISTPRWGNVTEDGSFRYIPYGGTFTGEVKTGGYTIPVSASVGWWFGTPDYQETIRLFVQDAMLD